MTDMRIEYSAAALRKENAPHKIEQARRFCESLGWSFGVQIHNSTPFEQLNRLAALGVPLSFHVPTYDCDYFINLANTRAGLAIDSLRKSSAVLARYNADLAVFHGFLMTDEPVLCFNDVRGYDQCMAMAGRPDLSRPGTSLCTDFLGSDEYRERFDRVKDRLTQIRRDYPNQIWCIENDYPAFSGGLLFAEQMAQVASPICLDVSHLWAACLLFDKNFLKQVEAVAASGHLRCSHFHANPLRIGTPIEKFNDGHRSLTTENQMSLPDAARIMYRGGLRFWILETYQADLPDLQLLADWLEKC